MRKPRRPIDKKAFGLRVRHRREVVGWSQTRLGNEIGVAQQTIVNVELGGVARPGFMRELVRALSTSEEWLWWEEGPEIVVAPTAIERVLETLKAVPIERLALAESLLKDLLLKKNPDRAA